MKDWSVISWIGFGVFWGVLILAFVFLVLALTQHEEAGFENSTKSWDALPLRTGCRGYTPDDGGACTAVAAAVGAINTRLGFDALTYVGRQADAPVQVTLRAPANMAEEHEPGGRYELHGDPIYTHCDVQTINVGGSGGLEFLVIYHELGHCLGLAHDDFEASIMFPEQAQSSGDLEVPWITDYDRELLRERYAQ